MWLPQGGALKIENLQFTQLQYYNAMLDYQSLQLHTHRDTHRGTHRQSSYLFRLECACCSNGCIVECEGSSTLAS